MPARLWCVRPSARTGDGLGSALVVALSVLMAAGSVALAQPGRRGGRDGRDLRIDRTTGRSLAHWATGPQCDFLHMRLELLIPDMETPHLEARQTLRVRGLVGERESLRLDARGLDIASIEVDGVEANFTQDGDDLWIHFPGQPLREGQERVIETVYAADYPTADGLGLNWTVGDPGGESETDRFGQIHTQGQAENNRRWFPCHDEPNERMATTLVVRVAAPFVVISNGRLVSRETGDDGLVAWTYDQERAHAAYLVSLVVGVFERIELAGPGVGAATEVPMSAYGPVGTAETMAKVFEGTPEMLAFFEDWLDEAYPWARYDQVCVRDFHSGGMENTAATTLYEAAASSTRAIQEDLISHELFHMWMGDLLTCRTWDHIWLNEGWATYGEVLWREEHARALAERDGLGEGDVAEEARSAMLEYVLQLMRVQGRFNRARAPGEPALVSNLFRDPETVFERADDPYNKGGAVLHMLRMMLGDEVFQRGTRLYVDRYKDSCVETDDFRRCLEEVSGRSLERFFTQWVLRPGMPRLNVTVEWIEQDKQLQVAVEQTQRIDADNPAYAFDLPIVVTQGREDRTLHVAVNERREVVRFPMRESPAGVSVDPMLNVFAETKVEKDLAWWREELESGPTVVARMQAAEAIGADPRSNTTDLLRLVRVAGDASERASVRGVAGSAAAVLAVRGLGEDVLPFGTARSVAQSPTATTDGRADPVGGAEEAGL